MSDGIETGFDSMTVFCAVEFKGHAHVRFIGSADYGIFMWT